MVTYLSGGDHDADLFDGLGEFLWLHSVIVVQIEVFEGSQENGLLVLHAARLLR